jgi:hypothetical protein
VTVTSVTPDLRNGVKATLCFCEHCGAVQVYSDSPKNKFPDTGHWTSCRPCGEWRFFFRICRGRVVNKSSRRK